MKILLILMLALSLNTSAQVELKLDSICTDTGLVTSVNFTTKNFVDIASLQGSIVWDSTKYNLVNTSNVNLSGMIFNTNTKGVLAFIWSDANVQGVTLSNGSTLFTMQFRPVTSSSGVFPIEFSNVPSSVEVSTTSGIVNHTTISGAMAIVDVATSATGALMMANNNSANYIWLDCNNNNSPIPGATNQTYTASENGDYAVQITENGCIDTSTCIEIMSVGIIKSSFSNDLLIYPNPTKGNLSVDLGVEHDLLTTIILDINGKTIEFKEHTTSQLLQLNIDGPTGVYLLVIESENKKAVIRLIKE